MDALIGLALLVLFVCEFAYLLLYRNDQWRTATSLTFIWLACEFVVVALHLIGFPLAPVSLLMLLAALGITCVKLDAFPVLREIFCVDIPQLLAAVLRSLHPRAFHLTIRRILWWAVGICSAGLALRVAGLPAETARTIVSAAFVYAAVMFAAGVIFRQRAEQRREADGSARDPERG